MNSTPQPHVVVFTGAGISAESGLKTFRDSGGLWEGYAVSDVATPEAWYRDQELVLQFYNERRKALLSAKPNAGHRALAELESDFRVSIITQNVDNLHEQAGSNHVLHLHGELMKARSTQNPELVYPVEGWELKTGDCCEMGAQLRPHIVWFGEAVPAMDEAYQIAQRADFFLVVGSSMVVYPAAGLIDVVPASVPKLIVDPNRPEMGERHAHIQFIEESASTGVAEAIERIKTACN
jgi:NAD-dependent deacetylase